MFYTYSIFSENLSKPESTIIDLSNTHIFNILTPHINSNQIIHKIKVQKAAQILHFIIKSQSEPNIEH